MKFKIDFILKALLFVLFLILTNCSNEFETAIKNSTNKNDISFAQFKKETGLKDFKTRISVDTIKSMSSARLADGSYELADFNISTEIIKRLEYEDKTTYTFKIQPVVVTNTDIYNLIVSNKDGFWQTTIIALKPTDENFEMIQSGLTDKFEGSIKKLYQSGLITNDNGFICEPLIIIDLHCPQDGVVCHDNICDGCRDCLTVQTYDFCAGDEDGNTGGGYVGPSDPGTTGGGPDGTTNPTNPPSEEEEDDEIPIIPNLEGPNFDLDPGEVSDPCLQLRTQTAKPAFVSKMNVLKNNRTGQYEKGFNISTNPNNEFSPIITGNGLGELDYGLFSMSDADAFTMYGSAHNHLNDKPDQVGVFGQVDLQDLFVRSVLEMATQNPNNTATPEKSVVYLISNIGFFALKINDIAKFQAYCVKWMNFSDEQKKNFVDNVFSHPNGYNITHNSPYLQQVKGFLRYLQDEDMGVDLFEGETNTYGGWKKLSLNSDGNANFTINSVPCP